MANHSAEVSRRMLESYLTRGYIAPISLEGLKVDGVSSADRGSHFEYRFANAHLLLKALDVEAEIYRVTGRPERRAFLFRGHTNANWDLLPSVFRLPMSVPQKKAKEIQKNSVRSHYGAGQMDRELVPFHQFLEGINDLGMFMENGSVDIMNDMRSRDSSAARILNSKFPAESFPTKEQLSALGIAQHYGLPTRLLDWTTNPYIALFFATEKIRSSADFRAEGELGLWILPRDLLDLTQVFKFLKVVEVPKFQNSNIIAQQGLFTSHMPSLTDVLDNGAQPPFDKNQEAFLTLDQYLTDHNEDLLHQQMLDVVGKPLLFKLKYDEIEPLRRKLDQLNINWRTLMPNLEGATKEAIRLSETQRVHD